MPLYRLGLDSNKPRQKTVVERGMAIQLNQQAASKQINRETYYIDNKVNITIQMRIFTNLALFNFWLPRLGSQETSCFLAVF
jgi:hypothetical protein